MHPQEMLLIISVKSNLLLPSGIVVLLEDTLIVTYSTSDMYSRTQLPLILSDSHF